MKLFSRADASSSKTHPAATRPIAPNLNRALIDDAAVYLVQLGVRPTFFEEEVYLSAGYTDPIYAGLLRPFSDAPDVDRCEQLLQLGVNHKFFATYRSMHMNQFTCFLHFLKSPSGQEALAKMAQRNRLAKRGGDLLSAQEVGTVSMLEAQINDISNEITDYHRREEEEAAYHELALCEISARTTVHIEEIKQSNPPGGFYQPLTVPELNRA
ncbi:uncharacterized protein LOC110093800 [Dendrobium catenatum]|uniref:uncharacterized protein LOC110093800 n=1 Tax=Dendrobium catenatum TaxID=906689 RepID=UPI0009F21366|nr:uncharacterized protein LOC110093800 [Dendrobium catenatum]